VHRFQQYVTGSIIPELTILTEPEAEQDSLRATLSRMFLFEQFLWMHLGLEIGAFSEAPVRAVYEQYFVSFFLSIAGWMNISGYTAPTQEGFQPNLLPNFGRRLFNKAMENDNDMLFAEPVKFEEPATLIGLFQTHLMLRSTVWRHPATRRFLQTLNYATNEEWNSLFAAVAEPAKIIEQHEAENPTPSAALIYTGYLNIFRYASRFKELSDVTKNDNLLKPFDVTSLESRILEIQKWTINLNSGEVFGRFQQVRERFVDMLRSDKDATGIVANIVEAAIDEALDIIGIPTPVTA
jgi:hypothetical protein